MKQKKADAVQIPKHVYEDMEEAQDYLHEVQDTDFYEYPVLVDREFMQIMALAPDVALSEEVGYSLMNIKEVWETWRYLIRAREDMRHKELHGLELMLQDYLLDLRDLRSNLAAEVKKMRRERHEQIMKEVS